MAQGGMNKTESTIHELSDAFERVLAHPPSQVGTRLRSERELAAALQVEHQAIRRAFDQLVERGYATRRHGSGTYVRKVPAMKGKIPKSILDGVPFSAEILFAKPPAAPNRKRPLLEHRRLNFVFVLREAWSKTETNKQILLGINSRIKQEGHHIKMNLVKGDASALEYEELIERMRSIQCDGFILYPFKKPADVPLESTVLSHPTPFIFVSTGERLWDHNYSPLVRLGLEDAEVRAIRILAEQGFSRIGFVACPGEGQTEGMEHFYEKTVADMGMDYRYTAFCEPTDAEAYRHMKKIFESDCPPDALYVPDDILLRNLAHAWKRLKLVPGKDFGLITLANRGVPLPVGVNWSCMEFHPFQLGRMVIDSLLLEIQNAGEAICSIEHLAIWRPGSTHQGKK